MGRCYDNTWFFLSPFASKRAFILEIVFNNTKSCRHVRGRSFLDKTELEIPGGQVWKGITIAPISFCLSLYIYRIELIELVSEKNSPSTSFVQLGLEP
ncbi:unnamed protein product [Orchesella dallaii]|uniref:Uncharacterized protein n=1 Tax=Orchesella dallaii TaxID=48710 RepID=A0ABP1R3S1_9HEXA